MRFQSFKKQISIYGTFLLLFSAPILHAQNESPALHQAVINEDTKALHQLITPAANLDIQNEDGWTALMFAVKQNRVDYVQLLLRNGASPNISDRLSRTPLQLAVDGPIEINRMLVKAGADLDVRNAGGISALMMAASKGRSDIVYMMLDAGAKLDFKDYHGKTAVDWAKKSGDKHLSQTLEKKLKLITANGPEKTVEDFDEAVFEDVTYPEWFKKSFFDLDDDLEEALNNGKKGLLVYVGLKRCSYCKAFMDNTLSQTDIEARVRKNFDAVGMDIFSNNEMRDPKGKKNIVRDFVTEEKAIYSPTMIFYGPKGEKVLKIVGYYPPEKFRKVLDFLEGEHYRKETLYSFMTRHKNKKSIAAAKIKQEPALFSNKTFKLNHTKNKSARPIMVLFERPDCEACDRFHHRVLQNKPIRRLIQRFEAIQLDATDSKTSVVTPDGNQLSPEKWFKQLDLQYSPSMVFYDEKGNEIMRLDSETKPWRMEGTLQLILAGDYKNDTQVQRWRRDKAVMFYQQSNPD